MPLSKQTIAVGGFLFDMQSGELHQKGDTVRLPEQPFKILQLFVARRGEVITRDELRAQLWPQDTFVNFDRSLNTAMKKLRDALGDSADQPAYIETIPRRGYRLIAPVRETHEITPKRRTRAAWIGGGVATAAIFLVAAMRFHASTPPHIRSIAVLPLANLSGDPRQEYLADGMTEALITDVAQLKEVRVISRTSVMPYKQSKQSLPEIARQLNVDGVIEGGVVRSGGRVRITVQLIQAATDQHLWAHSYEQDFGDLVTLQRDLSAAISEALHAELTPAAHMPRRVKADAYECYLRGNAAIGRETMDGVKEAIAYLEKAVAIQPDFAAAHASLSNAYSQLVYSGTVAPNECMQHAKEAALRAVALDPQFAAGHAALGLALFRYDWNWAASEAEMRRAISLNPNDVAARRAYAALLRTQHRESEAAAQTEWARALDPNRVTVSDRDRVVGAGARLRGSGDYANAIAQGRRAVGMAPALPRGHFQLGITLAEAGQFDEAVTELERAVALSPGNARFQARLAWAYALAGQQTKARAILAELHERAKHSYISPTALAVIHVALQERGAALGLLEQAYRDRDFELITLLNGGVFKVLQAEPRYQQLVRKIGLPA